MEAGEIDDQGFFGDMLVLEDGDVLEGQGNGLAPAHGHELEAARPVRSHAGGCEQGRNPLPARPGVLETAGEEMHRILSGTDDGDSPARLLEADACGEARQASADNHGIESHTPNTCL